MIAMVADKVDAMGRLMEGRSGLVTGAASGIGRACAIRLAREGAAVIVADLPGAAAGARETIDQIEA
ncbi:MAG TPA: SDR family NAD(P)-dependent oxidoreductase, partial [Solirubrobacteraceae bacterium]